MLKIPCSFRITLPAGQKVGCSGSVVGATDLGNGWQQVDIRAGPVRDFALFASYVALAGGGPRTVFRDRRRRRSGRSGDRPR